MAKNYGRTVWKNIYGKHEVTGTTYNKEKGDFWALTDFIWLKGEKWLHPTTLAFFVLHIMLKYTLKYTPFLLQDKHVQQIRQY